MSRRKLNRRHIRKIQKKKGTYSVSLPIDVMKEFRWKEKQKVEVVKYGKNKFLIRDWKAK